MRLVDADALMEEFAEFVAPANRSDFEPTPTWNDAVSLLGSAPTIEPKRGSKLCDEDYLKNVIMKFVDRNGKIHGLGISGFNAMLQDAEVESVKHGRWEWYEEFGFGNPYGSYKCSVCGNAEPHRTSYCCCCGAKMDEVDND